ncbi:MAG TPA: sulfatase-like hydrolase/transferase, partial [Devosia sp.]|nr:sulfatase-like hydrolase/transferase [Devosia sp.]
AEGSSHPLMDFALRFTPADSFAPGMTGLVRDFSDADFRQIRATYYGMIAEVDAQLGRVFAAIRARGEWDNTLIVFTSDHAEMLGDHFLLGKGGYYDQSQHIPLIIRDPEAAQRGERVINFTEAVDLYPTLLDELGVEPTHAADGASLRPFVSGNPPAAWRDAAHWEFDFREVASQAAETWFGHSSTQLNMAVIRTAEWKYVHFAALPPLLFDLTADPQCLNNLAGNPAYVAQQLAMAERLLSWRARHLDQTLALKELTPAGVVSRPVRAN